MKAIKRNAVIAAVVVFVGAAVYLNWAYNKKAEAPEAASFEDGMETSETAAETENTGLYYEEQESGTQACFDSARLERSRARDEAAAALSAVAETEGASQETIDAALDQLSKMAANAVTEAELETLICAKEGYSQCVVYLSDDSVTVTVAPLSQEGLSAAAAARITDTVTEKTGLSASALNIVEIK